MDLSAILSNKDEDITTLSVLVTNTKTSCTIDVEMTYATGAYIPFFASFANVALSYVNTGIIITAM